MQFRSILKMYATEVQPQQPQVPLVIGYYPVRAKAQLCRLLCEYFHIQYRDQFLNPNQWDNLKKTKAKDWIIKDLPYLADGDFTVTGSTSCSYYILQKSGRVDLLGRTLQDNIKITTYSNRKDMYSAALGLICKMKVQSNEQEMKHFKQYLVSKIEPFLKIHQKEAKEDDWYFGYITLLDFSIYLTMTLLQKAFAEDIIKFKKLNDIKQKVYNIAEIYKYENSDRAVRCYNPVEYFNSFKDQMFKKGVKLKTRSLYGKETDLE